MEKIITLKNGENIRLDWNFLTLQYLEEYEDGKGMEALKIDIENQKNAIKILNHMIYAIVCSNYDEVLTFRQAICLVDFKDLETIQTFITENLSEMEQFKKKGTSRKYTTHPAIKKKK